MQIEKMLTMVLVLVIVSSSYLAYVGSFSAVYGGNPDTTFIEKYNNITTISNTVNESENKLFTTGASSEFGFVPTIQAVMDIASLAKTSMKTITQMVNDMATYLHVPPVVTVAIVGILTIGFIFALIKITMRITQA